MQLWLVSLCVSFFSNSIISASAQVLTLYRVYRETVEEGSDAAKIADLEAKVGKLLQKKSEEAFSLSSSNTRPLTHAKAFANPRSRLIYSLSRESTQDQYREECSTTHKLFPSSTFSFLFRHLSRSRRPCYCYCAHCRGWSHSR